MKRRDEYVKVVVFPIQFVEVLEGGEISEK